MKYHVVDSSAWIEYFDGGPNASFFEAAIDDKKNLLVPATVFYEVVKLVKLRYGSEKATVYEAALRTGTPVAWTPELAVSAANLAIKHELPMADASIAATARAFDATLWTLDNDFRGLSFVKMPK